MITLVYSTEVTNDYVNVIAVVEDTRLVYFGSQFDPPEYGPGVCKAGFYLEEGETIPEDEEELIEYLERLDLDWELVDEDCTD